MRYYIVTKVESDATGNYEYNKTEIPEEEFLVEKIRADKCLLATQSHAPVERFQLVLAWICH